MRIVSIHVEGFGVLRERTLDIDSPLTLFYGVNEAGKSTLMSFIRAVLFGFPARSGRTERYEPPGGGVHGGSLTLLDEQGRRIRVERYDAPAAGGKRASAGRVTVTLEDGTSGGEELLSGLLGGLSADLFRSLFAFGLTELQELRTLQTEELSGYLYSAGLGVSGSAIMDAQRKLTAQAESLYKPKGRNQEINVLLKELDGLDQALRRSRDQAADYDRLQAEKRSAEERIAAAEERQEALRAELHRLDLAGKARSGWIRLKRIGQELETLPQMEGFPEQAAARLEALEAEQERLRSELGRLAVKRRGLQEKLDGMEKRPEVLVHQLSLNALLEQAPVYEEQIRLLDQLDVELEHQRERVRTLIEHIDAGWDVSSLESFPVSISLREQVRSFAAKLHQQELEKQRLAAELGALRLQIRRDQELLQALEAELEKKGIRPSAAAFESATETRAAALQRLAKDYSRWQLLARDAEHRRQREADRLQHERLAEEAAARGKEAVRRMKLRLSAAAAVAAVVLPAWLIWRETLAAGLVAFAALAALAVFFWLGGQAPSQKRSARPPVGIGGGLAASGASPEEERENEALGSLEASLREQIERLTPPGRAAGEAAAAAAALRQFGRSTQGDEASSSLAALLREFEPQLDAWLREADYSQRQTGDMKLKWEKLVDGRREWQIVVQQEEGLREAVREQHERTEELLEEWRMWLGAHRLHTGLSPEAALETIQAAEQGHELLRQLRKTEEKRRRTLHDIAEFEDKTAELLALPGAGTQGHDCIAALKRWKEAEQRQLSQLAERRQMMELLALQEEESQVLSSQLERVRERIAALLREASASDGEQLRYLQGKLERRAALLQEQSALEASLEALAGGSGLGELGALLDALGEDEALRCKEQAERQVAGAIEESNALRERLGKLAGEIELLEQGTAYADKLLQAEAARASIGQLAGQYAAASFASLLIKKARDVYERERQPSVLLRASSYFSLMTAGQFVQIRAPFAEQRLEAVRASGQAVDTGQLSRGTAEQLYLSMRFALAEEYAGKAVLPLVMDDILVNFDQYRMENCLKVIEELSKRHQILLFTCHSHVKEAASRLLPNHRLIEL